jgi:hypothetical protein
MNPFYVGLPAWLLCAFGAYGLREKAIGQLSAEQIGVVTLAQRADRINLLVFSVGILVVFLALRFSLPERQNLWFLLLLAATAAVSTYYEVSGCKSVLSLVPPHPARTLVASRALGLLGLLCLVGAMAATVL